jgi:CRISPR-associated endoribonuclease Cas6/Csy4 subtype I-F
MTTLSHFIEIFASEASGIASHECLREAIAIVHRQVFGRSFAMSFPDAVEEPDRMTRGGESAAAGIGSRPSLGNRVRVFGEEALMQELEQALTASMRDYLFVSNTKRVPVTATHVSVRRDRDAFETAADSRRKLRRLVRRAEARGAPMDPSEIKQRLADAARRKPDGRLPFFAVVSKSNGQNYAIAFRQIVSQTAGVGRFDCYGLSLDGATVPHF